MVWEKLIMNVAFSGSSCATGLTIGAILADPDAWSVARGCAEEAVAVASAAGVTLDVAIPSSTSAGSGQDRRRQAVDAARLRGGPALRDRRHQRSDPRLGGPLGVPTPVNDTVVGLVRSRERALLA